MQFVPFPSPRSWYQRDGMLLSNETWGPEQVCLKPLRGAMHHCSVKTHPNLWGAIQCTVKFNAVKSKQWMHNCAVLLTQRSEQCAVEGRDDYANALGALSLVTCEFRSGHSVWSLLLWCCGWFPDEQDASVFFFLGCIFGSPKSGPKFELNFIFLRVQKKCFYFLFSVSCYF